MIRRNNEYNIFNLLDRQLWKNGLHNYPDNPKKWLKMNNKERVDNGEEPENLSDFHIDEIDVEIFNKENL